jgi:integrase/recombinase XerD
MDTLDEDFNFHAAWLRAPEQAFAAFVASADFLKYSQRRVTQPGADGKPKSLRPSSIAIYCDMWRRYLRWLNEQDLSLFSVAKADLEAFLECRDKHGVRSLESFTIRRQYLTMFERVYRLLRIEPNPAGSVCIDISRDRTDSRKLRGRNQPTAALSPEEQRAFLDALPDVPSSEGNPRSEWKVRRDRALQAIMLGAGLKVSEAIRICTGDVKLERLTADDSVTVEVKPPDTNSAVKPHTTRLYPPASKIVLEWVAERKMLPISGDFLFPSTTRGGSLDKTVVYRKTRETYVLAGLDVAHKGGRTLRNTFAVSQLQAGQSSAVVREYLGHRDERSLDTYTTIALQKP